MNAGPVHLQSLLPKPSASATVRSKIPGVYAVKLTGTFASPPPKGHSTSSSAPWNPSQFQLWVERGVLWDLKQNQILGFIDYPSIEQYFSPTIFKPNKDMFIGSPFSIHDFPVYGAMGAYYSALVFSALHMVPYITDCWDLFRAQGLTNGATTPPGTASAVATSKEMRSFLAQTPNGTKTFSANYVAYMVRLHPSLQPWWPPS
jgi:hypothetical protein